MIRYDLQCKKGHAFDGWFKSSAAFDSQARRGLVTCPKCGDAKVTKAIMAPSIAKGRKVQVAVPVSAEATPQTDVQPDMQAAHVSPKQREILAELRKLRAEVTKNAEYVGKRFAEEARKIHHEETPARGIFGEATREEAQALVEEGVECYPLPTLPEDQN